MLWTMCFAAAVLCILWKMLAALADEANQLDQLPGPPKRPVFGNALEYLGATPRSMFVKLRQFSKQYGERYVVRIIGRRILNINNPKDVEIVLGHSKNIKKSKPYTFLEPWFGSGLLLSSGTKWHQRRKILTPTFHFNILKNFMLVMEEKCRHLVTDLKRHKEIEVDLIPTISDYTLNTICETAMGTQLDVDKSSNAKDYKNSINEMGSLLLSRLTRIWLHNEYLFRLFPVGRKFQKYLDIVLAFTDGVIAERRQKRTQVDKIEISKAFGEDREDEIGTKKRLAMLDLLLEAQDNGAIDLAGIKDEVSTFMFEGHDTTAMALAYCLMLLADHEVVQNKVYDECQRIFDDSDRTPTMADFSEMKYLEAVIKETLRIYPSVPFIAREITEDFMLDDLMIKKGSEVAVHIYDLHHRADLYPEPEEFRPDRFLGELRHPYAFVPFSAGPRNCIGQRFAMLEMKCVLSAISRNFKLVPIVKGYKPTLIADMLLRPAEPILVKFVAR